MDSIGGYPIHSVVLENRDKHWELMKDFVFDDTHWRPEEKWESKTKTSRDNQTVREHGILPIEKDIADEFVKFFQNFCSDKFNIHVESWANRYAKGDWQEVHDHVGRDASQFSYSYMLKTYDDECFGFCLEAQTSFLFPLFSEITGLTKPPELFVQRFGSDGKAIPKQKQGTLLIFPSNLAHFVLPNKQDQYRVTISGNFWIKTCAE